MFIYWCLPIEILQKGGAQVFVIPPPLIWNMAKPSKAYLSWKLTELLKFSYQETNLDISLKLKIALILLKMNMIRYANKVYIKPMHISSIGFLKNSFRWLKSLNFYYSLPLKCIHTLEDYYFSFLVGPNWNSSWS